MIWLILMSLFTFTAYLVAMNIKQGLQPSISHYYCLSKHKWLFSVVMLITGGLLVPPMLEYGSAQFLAFFSGVSVLFVAAAPLHKNNSVHKFFAISAGVCSIIWGLCNVWWITLLLLALWVLISTKLFKRARKDGASLEDTSIILMAEIAGFVNVYLNILLLM